MDFADARRMSRLAEVDDEVVAAAVCLLEARTTRERDAAASNLQAAIDLRRAAQKATR
jgi:hypothetical protein